MSPAHLATLKSKLGKCLLIVALPTACAVGTEPEGNQAQPDPGSAGSSGSGIDAAGTGTLAGTGNVIPNAGTGSGSGDGGKSSAFGGSSSTGGKAGSSSAGAAGSSSGGKGGSSSGGAGGSSAGASAGGNSGSGGGGAGCACLVKAPWMANMVQTIKPGDCVTVTDKTYLYTGVKTQTYANDQCNPTKQEAWCIDTSNDYNFKLCN